MPDEVSHGGDGGEQGSGGVFALGCVEQVSGEVAEVGGVEAQVGLEVVAGFDGEVDAVLLAEGAVGKAGDGGIVAVCGELVDEGLLGPAGASAGDGGAAGGGGEEEQEESHEQGEGDQGEGYGLVGEPLVHGGGERHGSLNSGEGVQEADAPACCSVGRSAGWLVCGWDGGAVSCRTGASPRIV